jgi:uncharacterized protein (DUF2461 family)
MTFNGFGKQALPFLKALDFHQDRDWFKANKALYESELETPRGDLVEALSEAFAAAGIGLKGDRKKSSTGSTAMCALPRTRARSTSMSRRC